MLFLNLCFLILSYKYENEYSSTSEGYVTLNPSQSPANIILNKGLALMMVQWPDATIKISIPDVLSKPITLTKEVGLSLFTFKDKASIEMNFNSKTSFFVAHCPQTKSINGALQAFSNYNNNHYSAKEMGKDLYYSFFGSYSIRGTVKSNGIMSSCTLNYWKNNETQAKLTDLDDFNIPKALFTSNFIRYTPTGSLTYDLIFNCSLSFKADVATAVDLIWKSVSANANNYNDNFAYGGKEEKPDYKESKIEDMKFGFQINAQSSIGAIFGYQINSEEIKQVSGLLIRNNERAPFILSLYVKYGNCKDFTKIKSYNIIDFTTKIIELSDDDIPSECKSTPDSYKVCFMINNLPSDYKLGYKVSNDPSGQIKVLTNDPIIYQNSFEVTLYLISSPSGCSNVELNKYQSSIDFECVSLTDSIIPDQCKTKYYVKIRNDIKLNDIHLFVKNRSGKDIEIIDNYEESDSTPFTVNLYVTSPTCSDLRLIAHASSEIDSSIVNSVNDSLIPSDCLPGDLKTFSVKIQNNLAGNVPSGKLYVEDRNGKKNELSRGKIYEDKSTQKDPFSVNIYVSSDDCQLQKVSTVTAKEDPELVVFDDSIFPTQCLPYRVCLISSELSGYSFGYMDLSDQKQTIKPISGKVSLMKNIQFDVQLYLLSSPNCENNHPISKYSSKRDLLCKILTLNDVPNECQSNPDSHKVCFITNTIPKEYKLGYKVSNDPSGQIKVLTNDPIVYQDSFEVTLYLISSPSGCSNVELTKYQSSTNFECVLLTESIIPDQCKTHYIIKLQNLITSREYKMFVKNRNNEYVEVEYEGIYEDSSLSPFSVNVYIKSSSCTSYSLADNGTFNSWTSQSHIEYIGDKYVPLECVIDGQIFYADIKNGLPSEYKLYAINRYKETVEITADKPYKDQFTSPFIVQMLVTSPQCLSPKYLTVNLISSFIENYYFEVTESYVPSDCLRPAMYEVCADLSSLSTKYEISYTKSYESGTIIASHGKNIQRYNHPFSITAYLTKSPGCSETVELGTYSASIDFECILVTADILPEECTAGDSSKTKDKGLSVGMIAGISGVGVLIIIIIVIVSVVIVKAKQKKAQAFNSSTLGSNLIADNISNQNF